MMKNFGYSLSGYAILQYFIANGGDVSTTDLHVVPFMGTPEAARTRPATELN